MNTKQIKIMFIYMTIITGSLLIGLGTSFYIGWGVFFLVWALASMIELANM